MGGLLARCLTTGDESYRYLSFLSLMSGHHINLGNGHLPIMSGVFDKLSVYDTQGQSVISDRLIIGYRLVR